jgi:hypothetical protein
VPEPLPEAHPDDSTIAVELDKPRIPADLPQNQRLLSELIGRSPPRNPLSFQKGDLHYGEALSNIKKEDDQFWSSHNGRIITQAGSSSSAAKRMFLELRNIRAAKVPFVGAAPLDDNLDRILASIEGPPETPYGM